MEIGSAYKIKLTNDEKNILIVAQEVSKWDFVNKEKILTKNIISDPSELAISNVGNYFILKNTSGIICKVNTDSFDTEQTFNQYPMEGCNLVLNSNSESVVNADWNGNIYKLSTKSFELLCSYNFANSMITHIQALPEWGELAFIVQPKWNDSEQNIKKPYIVISDWDLNNMRMLQFDYIDIKYFSIDTKSMMILLHARNDNGKFIIELRSLADSKLVFSNPVGINGSGIGCEINSAYNYFVYIDKGKIVFYDITKLEKMNEIPITYPSSLSLSSSKKYLGIGSWKEGVIIDNTNYEII